jgi:hypothetical protein
MIGWLIGRPKVVIGLVLVALFAGWTVIAYRHGVKTERADWTERQRIAEAAARQTEHDLADLAAKGAARLAEKERLLNDQARRSAETIRTLLAGVPECRVPRAVGRVLDATAGSLPATPAVARLPDPGPDDSALDAVIGLADVLDTVNANYSICRANIERLSEARDWYTDLRERVNME